MSNDLRGKRVRVHFNPATWPIGSGVYIYEGHNEHGHFVRRKDGTQRVFADSDVLSVEPVEEDVNEGKY